MREFLACWRSIALNTFGSDPSVAFAKIDDGITGDIYFAQTLEREGNIILKRDFDIKHPLIFGIIW